MTLPETKPGGFLEQLKELREKLADCEVSLPSAQATLAADVLIPHLAGSWNDYVSEVLDYALGAKETVWSAVAQGRKKGKKKGGAGQPGAGAGFVELMLRCLPHLIDRVKDANVAEVYSKFCADSRQLLKWPGIEEAAGRVLGRQVGQFLLSCPDHPQWNAIFSDVVASMSEANEYAETPLPARFCPVVMAQLVRGLDGEDSTYERVWSLCIGFLSSGVDVVYKEVQNSVLPLYFNGTSIRESCPGSNEKLALVFDHCVKLFKSGVESKQKQALTVQCRLSDAFFDHGVDSSPALTEIFWDMVHWGMDHSDALVKKWGVHMAKAAIEYLDAVPIPSLPDFVPWKTSEAAAYRKQWDTLFLVLDILESFAVHLVHDSWGQARSLIQTLDVGIGFRWTSLLAKKGNMHENLTVARYVFFNFLVDCMGIKDMSEYVPMSFITEHLVDMLKIAPFYRDSNALAEPQIGLHAKVVAFIRHYVNDDKELGQSLSEALMIRIKEEQSWSDVTVAVLMDSISHVVQDVNETIMEGLKNIVAFRAPSFGFLHRPKLYELAQAIITKADMVTVEITQLIKFLSLIPGDQLHSDVRRLAGRMESEFKEGTAHLMTSYLRGDALTYGDYQTCKAQAKSITRGVFLSNSDAYVKYLLDILNASVSGVYSRPYAGKGCGEKALYLASLMVLETSSGTLSNSPMHSGIREMLISAQNEVFPFVTGILDPIAIVEANRDVSAQYSEEEIRSHTLFVYAGKALMAEALSTVLPLYRPDFARSLLERTYSYLSQIYAHEDTFVEGLTVHFAMMAVDAILLTCAQHGVRVFSNDLLIVEALRKIHNVEVAGRPRDITSRQCRDIGLDWRDISNGTMVSKWRVLSYLADNPLQLETDQLHPVIEEMIPAAINAVQVSHESYSPFAVSFARNMIYTFAADSYLVCPSVFGNLVEACIDSFNESKERKSSMAYAIASLVFHPSMIIRSAEPNIKDTMVNCVERLKDCGYRQQMALTCIAIYLTQSLAHDNYRAIACGSNLLDIFVELLLSGPLERKEELIDMSSGTLEGSGAHVTDDDYVGQTYCRVTILNFLDQLLADHSDCAEFAESLLVHLIELNLKPPLSYSYRVNDRTCRRLVRLWKTVTILIKYTRGHICQKVEELLARVIVENDNLAAVRYFIELSLVNIYIKFPLLVEECLMTRLHQYNCRPQTAASFVVVSGWACIDRLKKIANGEDNLGYEQLLNGLIAWSNVNNHGVKILAQVMIFRSLELLPEADFKSIPLYASIKNFLAAHSESCQIRERHYDYSAEFDPVVASRAHAILSNEEGMDVFDTINDLVPVNFLDRIRLAAKSHLADVQRERNAELAFESQAEADQFNLQRKIKPEHWTALQLGPAGDEDQFFTAREQITTRNRGDLIVVATLVGKIPNLAGLCRTCEIFNASQLVIADKAKVIADKQFEDISVSANRWLPITEVNENALGKFLMDCKEDGYALVGLEQTANSTDIRDFEFPEKTVLVLGKEKEGIPVKYIQLLEHCVEIPQLGIIRSLNVHVSGAIMIWEYTKQHLGDTQVIESTPKASS